MTSISNPDNNIFLRETVLYIDPTSVSSYRREFSCEVLIYFVSHTNVPSFIVSPFTYIELCNVYIIDVNCMPYKKSANGSSMLISP